MLSFSDAFPAHVLATSDPKEVELLTHERWYHESRPLHYFLSVTYRPRSSLSAALGTCMSSCSVSLHASEWPRTDDSWLVSSPRYHIRSTLAVATHREAVLIHSSRPSAMPCRPSVRPPVRPSMAIHEVASLELERLLLRACHDVGVVAHAQYVHLVQ